MQVCKLTFSRQINTGARETYKPITLDKKAVVVSAMKQKRKKVRRAEFAVMTEEEKTQMRTVAQAEGKPFPAEGQDLDETIYSYYSERTANNDIAEQSSNAGTQLALNLSGAISLDASLSEDTSILLSNQKQH